MSEPLNFDEAKAIAVADLRAVAMLFENAADAAEKGDIGQVEIVCAKMHGWQQMLLIRHEDRMDRLGDKIPLKTA